MPTSTRKQAKNLDFRADVGIYTSKPGGTEQIHPLAYETFQKSGDLIAATALVRPEAHKVGNLKSQRLNDAGFY